MTGRERGGEGSGPSPGEDALMLAEATLELVAELQGVLDLVEFRGRLLEAVGRAVPSDWVSLNEIGSRPGDLVAVAQPPLDDDWVARFAPLAHENPLVSRYERTKDGRAYRFSDVVTPEELHGLAIYREFYSLLGVEHQMAFTLPAFRPGRFLGVALSRRDRDFTDAERALLDRARPFLIQAYRNVLAYAELAAAPDRVLARGSGDLTEVQALLREAGLTPREAEVLGWVATGRSDAAVGQALGISLRTVSKHLERAYAKLGVTNRSDAATIVWSLITTPEQP